MPNASDPVVRVKFKIISNEWFRGLTGATCFLGGRPIFCSMYGPSLIRQTLDEDSTSLVHNAEKKT